MGSRDHIELMMLESRIDYSPKKKTFQLKLILAAVEKVNKCM